MHISSLHMHDVQNLIHDSRKCFSSFFGEWQQCEAVSLPARSLVKNWIQSWHLVCYNNHLQAFPNYSTCNTWTLLCLSSWPPLVKTAAAKTALFSSSNILCGYGFEKCEQEGCTCSGHNGLGMWAAWQWNHYGPKAGEKWSGFEVKLYDIPVLYLMQASCDFRKMWGTIAIEVEGGRVCLRGTNGKCITLRYWLWQEG